MTNLEKLAIIIGEVLEHEMDERIYRGTIYLMYLATVYGTVSTYALQEIETAICKKLDLDYIEVCRKYYHLVSYVSVDDIIFDFDEYEWKRTGEVGYTYTVDIIKFRKEDYRETLEIYDDDEYVFDDDDTEF